MTMRQPGHVTCSLMSHSVELNGNLYFQPNQTVSPRLNMQNLIYRAQKSAHATMHRLLAHLTSHTFGEMYSNEWMNVCVWFDFIYFRANCILTRASTKFYGSNWKLWLFWNGGVCVCVPMHVIDIECKFACGIQSSIHFIVYIGPNNSHRCVLSMMISH